MYQPAGWWLQQTKSRVCMCTCVYLACTPAQVARCKRKFAREYYWCAELRAEARVLVTMCCCRTLSETYHDPQPPETFPLLSGLHGPGSLGYDYGSTCSSVDVRLQLSSTASSCAW
jgi:hypothetical protein